MRMSAALPPTRAQHDQAGLGWLILLPLMIILFTQAAALSWGEIGLLKGALADPDSYMRLVRLLDLYESGQWFDPREERINSPLGHVQHWTRPVDAFLFGGAWLLKPWFGFEQGLYVWGVLFSPVCLGLTVTALNWATRPLLSRDARFFASLALLLQPIVINYSSVGRADHHALLLLICVILLGDVIRMLDDASAEGRSSRAGIVAAFGFWVSAEAMIFIAIAMLAMGIAWIGCRNGSGRANKRFATALTGGTLLALLIERPLSEMDLIENDRLSLIHLTAFGSIAMFWRCVLWMTSDHRMSRYQTNRIQPYYPIAFTEAPFSSRIWPSILMRLIAAALGLALIVKIMTTLFPEISTGPLGRLDALYEMKRLRKIAELQPLISGNWLSQQAYGNIAHRLFTYSGAGVVALPFLIYHMARGDNRSRIMWSPVVIGLAVFLSLGFHQMRWLGYTGIYLSIAYAAAFAAMSSAIINSYRSNAIIIIRPIIFVIALFWPLSLGSLFEAKVVEISDGICPIEMIASDLNAASNGQPKTILTLADHGPALLYRTSHRVLSIPNHRPQPGFASTFNSLTSTDMNMAKRLLDKHAVDWILLCPGQIEQEFFATRDADRLTLYQRILDDRLPEWLETMPLSFRASGDRRVLLFAYQPANR